MNSVLGGSSSEPAARKRSGAAGGRSIRRPAVDPAPVTSSAPCCPSLDPDSTPSPTPADPYELVHASKEAAAAVDARWRILAWNGEAEKLLGFPESEVRGLGIHDVLGARDLFGNPMTCFCGPLHAIRNGESPRPFVIEADTRGGDRIRIVVYVGAVPPHESARSVVFRFRPDHRRRQVDRRSLNPGSFPLPADTAQASQQSRLPRLSQAELTVLGLLAAGKRADEIAETLCNSVATVRHHIQHILRKLGAHNQAQAISLAIRTGLV